jgi:hypothetical protein
VLVLRRAQGCCTGSEVIRSLRQLRTIVGLGSRRHLEQLGEPTLEDVDAASLLAHDIVEIVAGLAAKRGFDLELGQPALLLMEPLV